MILKHNYNMKKWAKWCLVIIVGVLFINTIFHIPVQADKNNNNQTDQTNQKDNEKVDAQGTNTGNYTTKEYQAFVACSNKARQENPGISQKEIEQKCRGYVPTNCNLEGAIGWIMCPFLFTIGEGTDASYNFIQGMLTIDIQFFKTDSSNSAFEPWKQIRNLANVGLIIFFMIVIISQVTGFGISNYGIKKILPKIIMATILINVSYVISQFLIDLSNLVGSSVLKLFQGFENTVFLRMPNSNPGGVAATGLSGALMIILGIMTIKQVSIMTSLFALVVPLLVSFILIVVVTGLILLIRQAAAIVLVIIAPIAFLSLIFPNTERLFIFWKKGMSGVLVLFPVVGMLFGAAGFISKLLVSSSDTFLMQTLGLVISGMPLVFTPSIVKSTLAAIPMIGTTFGNAFNKLQAGTNNAVRNSRMVQFAKQQHQHKFEQLQAGDASHAHGPFKWQERATAGVLGTLNRHTKSGQARLYDIENRRADNISNMSSRIADQDLESIMKNAKNGFSNFKFNDLSQETRQAMLANGYDENNTAELASAAMLKHARNGDLSTEEFSGVMEHALSQNMAASSAYRIAEEARKSSNDKGRFDTAGYIRGLQKETGGINSTNLSRFRTDKGGIASTAITNQLNSMGSDEIAKINKKALENGTNGHVIFNQLYHSSPQFQYNTNASLKDPNMSADTYKAITEAI